MNSLNYKLCDKIIPASYVRRGLEARKVLEKRVMQLLEQACILCCRKKTLTILYSYVTSIKV